MFVNGKPLAVHVIVSLEPAVILADSGWTVMTGNTEKQHEIIKLKN